MLAGGPTRGLMLATAWIKRRPNEFTSQRLATIRSPTPNAA